MGRPYRPLVELEGHLARGELDFAITLAAAGERARPLDLGLGSRRCARPRGATRRAGRGAA
ncbi:MAG TPA: hypothetical protein VK790_07295 [Solirubrobacteraceae bacterium]|nr:hypothetical protein [Solirubrobacteraceae bacterium]